MIWYRGGVNVICQHCQQREAIVHFFITENAKTREIYLCEQCAKNNKEIGFVFNPAIVPEFLKAIFDSNTAMVEQPSEELTCPQCGVSLSGISKMGKLGCNICYDAFETQLEPLLRRLHGGGQNLGKVPARRGVAIKNNLELKNLKERLQLLIQQELFEEAAVVRDKIRRLEQAKEEEKHDA